MARTRPYRPACFDQRTGRLLYPHVEFVITPPAGRASISVGGVVLLAGQRLDKRLVDARRLRQMYEGRLIAVAPGSVLPVVREKRPLAIGRDAPSLQEPPVEPAASPPRGVSRRRMNRVAAA